MRRRIVASGILVAIAMCMPLGVARASLEPTGRLFVRTDGANDVLLTLDPDGSHRRKVIELADAAVDVAPDGRHVVFERGDALFTMRSDGTGRRRLSPRSADWTYYRPVWSNDGSRVLFTRWGRGRQSIGFIRVSDRHVKEVFRYFINAYKRYWGVGWSPRDNFILLQYSAEGRVEIDRVAADGTNFRFLARGYAPTWQPGGRHIAFIKTGCDYPCVTNVAVMGADGSGLRFLTRTPDRDEYYPQWSPDGDTIIYLANGVLRKTNPSRDGSRVLARNVDDASWSPDGRFIAYAHRGGGSREIRIMKKSGRGKHAVTDTPNEAERRVWWRP